MTFIDKSSTGAKAPQTDVPHVHGVAKNKIIVILSQQPKTVRFKLLFEMNQFLFAFNVVFDLKVSVNLKAPCLNTCLDSASGFSHY